MSSDAASIAIRNYSFIKGRLAEAIVERLFISMGMDVYPVGLEAKLPRIAALKARGKLKKSAIQRFEYGPDFIICTSEKDDGTYGVYEVEVKFRHNSKIDVAELDKYDGPDTYFILIDDKAIYCLKKSDLEKIEINTIEVYKDKFANGIAFSQCDRLENCKDFNFSRAQKNRIKAFCGIIEASLGSFISHGKFSKDLDKYRGLIDKEIIGDFNSSK